MTDDLPEVNLVVHSEKIVAKTRKLKAIWTYDAFDDFFPRHPLPLSEGWPSKKRSIEKMERYQKAGYDPQKPDRMYL